MHVSKYFFFFFPEVLRYTEMHIEDTFESPQDLLSCSTAEGRGHVIRILLNITKTCGAGQHKNSHVPGSVNCVSF